MVRISGIDLLDKQLIRQALTALYGIGYNNVHDVLKKANVRGDKRVHELSDIETKNIQQVIDSDYIVEGDLQRQINDNINRMRVSGSYRGRRHSHGLPVRGQRTRSNARTGRGKRKTVGAMKKDDRIKMADSNKK